MARGRHANSATEAFGGASTSMRPRSSRGDCRTCSRPPCELCHWLLRWSPQWGHDPRGGGAEMARGGHANPATGTLSGAPTMPRSS
eukprot:9349189-Pyramimonas_sp.AAC.1